MDYLAASLRKSDHTNRRGEPYRGDDDMLSDYSSAVESSVLSDAYQGYNKTSMKNPYGETIEYYDYYPSNANPRMEKIMKNIHKLIKETRHDASREIEPGDSVSQLGKYN